MQLIAHALGVLLLTDCMECSQKNLFCLVLQRLAMGPLLPVLMTSLWLLVWSAETALAVLAMLKRDAMAHHQCALRTHSYQVTLLAEQQQG